MIIGWTLEYKKPDSWKAIEILVESQLLQGNDFQSPSESNDISLFWKSCTSIGKPVDFSYLLKVWVCLAVGVVLYVGVDSWL